MTKTIRLNDLQLVLLSGAAARDNGSLIPLPETCRQDTTRIGKAIASLLRRDLIEESPVTDRSLTWCGEDQDMVGLFITEAGRAAIGVMSENPDSQATKPEQLATRPISKISQVLSLLRRKDGATLTEMVAATGWLPHTTRAALTSLKKKGHVITKGKRDDVTCYHIAAEG